jgi:hypothetical protein
MSLSAMQLHLLRILDNVTPDALTGQEVLNAAERHPTVTSPWRTREGVHQTAGSLSRRGLVIKHNPSAIPQRGISYAISVAGKTALKNAAKSRSGIVRGGQT